MHMYLSDDTTFPHYTPPTKGKFWDFAVAAVAVSTDEIVWKFPKNAAIIMIVDCDVKPPHGVIVHRLIQKDQDPFSHSIAVAVKDTVRQVVSQGSLKGHGRVSGLPGLATCRAPMAAGGAQASIEFD